MKKLIKKLEDIYAAVAFTEDGEVETAREILREEIKLKKRKRTTPRSCKQLRAPGAGR